ncbi:hypothetical protein CDL12_15178 [Handroanthus impetiginosus]|uniref:Uncharacterized protein n=1 Tax=Handroanthus impetiginosus TaxID=429701 RepID=A0A2G9H3X9_9LAMI|nr:hypothetical protein CDL12_15178 [Handroanthus impetiginosus]
MFIEEQSTTYKSNPRIEIIPEVFKSRKMPLKGGQQCVTKNAWICREPESDYCSKDHNGNGGEKSGSRGDRLRLTVQLSKANVEEENPSLN